MALSPGIAAAASEIETLTTRPAGHRRALSLSERTHIFGAQKPTATMTADVAMTEATEEAGATHPWQAQVGGTSTSSLNKQTAQAIVGWSGRGPSIGLALFHSSKGQTNGIVGTKWTFSYNVYLSAPSGVGPVSEDGPSGASLQVVEGNGQGNFFAQNIDGSYSAPPGVHDTLTAAGGGYNLTRKDQSVWHFNSAKFLQSITDRNGNAVTLSYDSNNHLQSVTDAVGRSLTFGWSTDGKHILTVTDPTSRVWTLSYSGDNLASVTEPTINSASYTTSFGYDGASHVTSITDKRGKVWSFTYTGDGISTETDPLGHTTSYATGTASGVTTTTITDPNSHSVTHKYSTATGDLVEVDDALANATTFGYDANHNKTSTTDRRGKVTTATYDSRGNVLTVTDPLSHTTTFTYDTQNNPLTTTTSLGYVTTNVYDSNGNLQTVTDPLGHQSSSTRNTYGEITVTTDPLYHTKSMAYDSQGNVTSITDALGHTTTSAYDALGRVTSIINAVGLTSTTTYDAWGRAVSVTAPGSRTTTFAYDAASHKTGVTNALGKTDTFVYDNAGRLTSHTDALNRTLSYGYDNAGNKTSVTDGNGHTTYYSYTNRNQMSGIGYPDSTGETYSYYATGEFYQKTDGRGIVTQYSLNDNGQVTGIGYSDGTPTVSVSYDNDSRKTSMTDGTGTTSYGYDNAGRVTNRTTPEGTVTFAYDDANREVGRTIASGTTTLAYDNADRLTSAAAPGASGTETTAYSYDDAGRPTVTTLANGGIEIKTYSTSTGDLVSIGRKASASGPTVTSFAYGYDAVGRKTSETLSGGTQTSYGYDDTGLLTSETRTGLAAYSIGYSYDNAGNRLTKTQNGATENYSYDAANKLLAAGSKTYTYDAAGNTTSVSNSATGVTTTLSWDAEERLKTAGNGTFSDAYAYNGLDQRSEKADSMGTFSYLRAGDGIASPVLADGAATYNYGAGLVSEVRGGTSKFYQADAVGSTRELTDSSGTVTDAQETDAFGNTITSSGSTPTPFGFAGQSGYQSDSDTGLKLLGHRYYDSSTGRFISRDPIQDGNNWYVYCGNDPVNGLDATGLFDWVHAGGDVLAGVAGGIIGGPVGAAVAIGLFEGVYDYGQNGDVGHAVGTGVVSGVEAYVGGKVVGAVVEALAPAIADLGEAIFGNCFVAGTQVQMADGSTKPVEQIKSGDAVATKDQHDKADQDKNGNLGGVTSGKVVRTFIHKDAQTLVLSFGNGEKITTTLGHPFFVEGKGWTLSGQLVVGDTIVSRLGNSSQVASIELGGKATVYNFEVQNTHTYFVGETNGGLWVHNASMFNSEFSLPDGTVGTGASGPKVTGRPISDVVDEVVADGFTSKNPGGCSEIHAIDDAGYGERSVEGGHMETKRGGSGDNAGKIGEPCDVCKEVMRRLNITWTPGDGW